MVAFEKAYFFFSTNTLARVLSADKDKLEEDELVNRAATVSYTHLRAHET